MSLNVSLHIGILSEGSTANGALVGTLAGVAANVYLMGERSFEFTRAKWANQLPIAFCNEQNMFKRWQIESRVHILCYAI